MTREERFINFFESLMLQNLSQISSIFAHDAHFKDPFNDVVGREKIQTVFTHMFATTQNPTFVINHSASNGNHLFIQWDFSFKKSQESWQISGCSMVSFNQKNEVKEHIDFWDTAEQIYSKVGILKYLIRFLVSRLTAQES